MTLSEINVTNSINSSQPLTAALYARVSTNRQEELETIESQLAEIKERIKGDGNILQPENIFVDDGWTGEILQRPSLDAMRDAAQEGKFTVLYVYDRGRLSRVFAYQEIVLEELTDRGIKFVTLHDIKAETPEERVMQAMQGVFHEYERVKIAERMRRGKLYKARNGLVVNGGALYGWNYIKKTDTTPTHWVVNDAEARIVRMIHGWVGNERLPLREVIRKLHTLGIMPRKGKSDHWTKGPLLRLLRCETYITGIAYYNKSEAVVAKHPIKNVVYRKIKRNSRIKRSKEEWIPFNVPVILEDRDLFNRVRAILDENKRYVVRKNRKYDYLLSGRVYCECGNRRVGDGVNHSNFYYRCTERILKFPAVRKCKSDGVNAVVLDGVLWKELVRLLTNTVLLRQHAEEWLRYQMTNDPVKQANIRDLESLISKVEEEELRYAKAYGSGAMEFEQYRGLTGDTAKRKTLYRNQLEEVKNRTESLNLGQVSIEALCAEAKKMLENLDLANKIDVVKDIIEKVIVFGNREAEVWGHIPVNLANLNMGLYAIGRNCGLTKCGKVYTVQRIDKKTTGPRGQLSLRHYRAKRRCGTGARRAIRQTSPTG